MREDPELFSATEPGDKQAYGLPKPRLELGGLAAFALLVIILMGNTARIVNTVSGTSKAFSIISAYSSLSSSHGVGRGLKDDVLVMWGQTGSFTQENSRNSGIMALVPFARALSFQCLAFSLSGIYI